MIEFRNVTKKYGKVGALEDVSFKVAKGEIFTLIGPNGSGKSTILRIMAGIDRPTEGEMYFDGERVDDENLSKVREKCTLVFQRTVLFNMTVEKNVAYGLKLRKVPKMEIDKKVREALRMVKLEGYEKRWSRRLSSGEQQRVSLSRALALETDVLLLDEPTANLDPKNVSIIEETISRVNQKRKTMIVMATHNMFQAEILATRAALLINGKIPQIGTPQEIFKRPSKYLASFARLENLFTGTSKVSGGGTSLIDLDDNVVIETANRREGRVTFFVRPEDIILSKERIVSSARNIFKGEIAEISDLGNTVKLKVDAGRDFIVQITKRSFREMGLNLGSKVFITFKASTVHVISHEESTL